MNGDTRNLAVPGWSPAPTTCWIGRLEFKSSVMLVNNRQLSPVGIFLACYVLFALLVCDYFSGVPVNRLEQQDALPL